MLLKSLAMVGITVFLTLGSSLGHAELALPKAIENAHNRYEAAGITDPKAFEAFYVQLQEKVAKGAKEEVASQVKYPLRVNKEGGPAWIRNEEQFREEYDEIITEKVRRAFLEQAVTDTFVNYQGVMVGDGEMWLGPVGDSYGIIAVNL